MSVTGTQSQARSTGLEEAYEQLRSRAVKPACRDDRPVGYGLVVHRGLFTWMRATPTPEVLQALSSPTTRLPAKSELVNAIVSLIVGSARDPELTM